MSTVKTEFLLHELNAEYRATRACLERIPESSFGFKPHEKSMTMGYLVQLVAEIPLWVKHMIVEGEIDFVTFPHANLSTTKDVISHFEDNMRQAREALKATNDNELEAPFSLKANGELLYTAKKVVDLGITINHWVHHRGQLTVYMRLNNIDVPSIYGPSADDKTFTAPK